MSGIRLAPLADADLESPDLAGRLRQVLVAMADAEALSQDDEAVTYRALDARVGRLASAIRAATAHASRDPRPVALLVPRAAEVEAVLACVFAGHPWVVLDASAPASVLAPLVARARAVAVAACGPLVERARELHAAVVDLDGAPDDAPLASALEVRPGGRVASILFTSGSSGPPKGVLRSAGAIVRRALIAQRAGLGPGVRASQLHSARFGTSDGEIFGALLTGATLCVGDLRGLSPLALGDWVARERVALFHPPIPLFRRLLHALRRPIAAPALRRVVLGGEALAMADVALAGRLLPRSVALEHRFSASECGPIAGLVLDPARGLPDVAPDAMVPVGSPVPDREVRLVDGEVWVSGPHLALGYLDDPRATAERFAPHPTPGWSTYRTGDQARWDDAGRLVHLGRRDRLAKVRGQRVNLAEIEAALLALGDVREAAAVVAPDALGEPWVEAWVAGGEREPHELRAELRRSLPAVAIPGAIFRLPALPLTAAGKVDRRALRGRAHPDAGRREGTATPASEGEGGDPRAALNAIWDALIGCGLVDLDASFLDLGGDSLLAAELAARIELAFRRRLTVADLFSAPTLGAQLALIDVPRPAPGESLVPLATAARGPALFCVHPLGGGVGSFVALARELADDLPVYGFQARGFDRREAPEDDVVAIARRYVAELRAVQPEGPYFIAGRCLGGTIAIEMARQLEDAGSRVPVVALFDDISPPPRTTLRGLFDLAVLVRRDRDPRAFEALVERLAPPPAVAGFARRLAARVLVAKPVDDALALALRRARWRYVLPSPIRARIILFAPAFEGREPRYVERWRLVAEGGVLWEPAPGNHQSMFHAPHIGVIAKRLADHLHRVEGRTGRREAEPRG